MKTIASVSFVDPLDTSKPYMSYLILAESAATLCLEVFSVAVLSHLAFRSIFLSKTLRYGRRFSPTLFVYLLCQVIFGALAIPYHVYVIGTWNPGMNKYDLTALYWLGMHTTNYLTIVPVALFFVILERCIALKLPIFHSEWMQGKILMFSIAAVFATFVFSITAMLLELPLQMQACKKNLVVRNTVIFDFFLCVVPNYFSVLFNLIADETSANYLGQYVMLLGSVNAAICGLYYSAVFLRNPSLKDDSIYVHSFH
ncbi:hypothetical protein DdX_15901 [Ditylenchus destructor]|uniref:Uncharacterized protein n=1 Tax=Ditylenchus destructor TaxID=166010 RepID=A0AAD4MPG0_9BILA|nr:hypothetical protein DdX_15901 [Ditylenchus destructor]